MAAMTNSDDSKIPDAVGNAGEIIERFGGIRPMATKMNVPVTTVQGWKKRNVIPGNRLGDVMAAARSNNIDLSDLVTGVANQNSLSSPSPSPSFASPASSFAPPSDFSPAAAGKPAFAPAEKEARKQDDEVPPEASFRHVREERRPASLSNEDFIRQIEEAQAITFNKSAWFAVGLVTFVVAVAAIILWPGRQQINSNTRAIVVLQGDLSALKDQRRSSIIQGLLPDDIQERIAQMQQQAETIQDTVTGLSAKIETMASGAVKPGAPMGQKLMMLERQAAALGAPVQLTSLLNKVLALQNSPAGRQQLSRGIATLNSLIGSAEAQGGSIETALEQMQQDKTDELGAALDGLASEDLKAAALLVGLAQFRSSMNRSAPFAEDLALMNKLLGDKDPELAAALERLAPKAEQGVLTPQGLQKEFKGLAGDIVVSSLKGEDVSVQERARARLNDILRVEKDGELITGTDTQATVARAQKMLDEGDIEGAISVLQTLEGDAAETAAPFMGDAEFTMLAQKAQEMMTSHVIGAVKGHFPGGSNPGIDQLVRSIGGMAVPRHVIRDEDSGFAILAPAPLPSIPAPGSTP